MPSYEQLLNADLNHIRPLHSSYRSLGQDMGPSQCSNADCAGTNEEVDAQYEEFWRIQRSASLGKSSLYTLLWYASHMMRRRPRLIMVIRRLPYRFDIYRRRHPIRDQAHKPHQLRQTCQDRGRHPRHSAIPKCPLPPQVCRRLAGLHTQQHASGWGCARDVRQEFTG